MPMPKKKTGGDKFEEDWLITFSDAVTLLMAFFVMMLTFAEYDIPAFEEAAQAIKREVAGKAEISTTEKLKLDIEDVVFQLQADQVVQVTKDEKGITIDLASNAFYEPGSAVLREAAIPVLEKITETLLAPRYDTYNIAVEGHTDDDPISTELFPSNWELAGRRASRVVRFFIENSVADVKLHSTSFADTKPKVPNRDTDGNAIPENQSTNRRTSIRVQPMSLKERGRWIAYQTEERRKRKEAEREAKAQEESEAERLTQEQERQEAVPGAGQSQPPEFPAPTR